MVDPFWHKVQEAYNMVRIEPTRRVTVELNGLKADVVSTDGYVAMRISEVPVEQPVLISPGHDERG